MGSIYIYIYMLKIVNIIKLLSILIKQEWLILSHNLCGHIEKKYQLILTYYLVFIFLLIPIEITNKTLVIIMMCMYVCLFFIQEKKSKKEHHVFINIYNSNYIFGKIILIVNV